VACIEQSPKKKLPPATSRSTTSILPDRTMNRPTMIKNHTGVFSGHRHPQGQGRRNDASGWNKPTEKPA
jgi:hypothetical protein